MNAQRRHGDRMLLRIALWIVQVALAASFGMSGVLKSTRPLVELAQARGWMPWSAAVPLPLLHIIGVAEVLGAVGLVLPALTRILPRLTPLAALGIALIMALAAVFHLFRGEFMDLPTTFILGALAVFVAWGRSRAAPIAPR